MPGRGLALALAGRSGDHPRRGGGHCRRVGGGGGPLRESAAPGRQPHDHGECRGRCGDARIRGCPHPRRLRRRPVRPSLSSGSGRRLHADHGGWRWYHVHRARDASRQPGRPGGAELGKAGPHAGARNHHGGSQDRLRAGCHPRAEDAAGHCRSQRNCPVDLVPHVPGGARRSNRWAAHPDSYVDEIIGKMLPAVCGGESPLRPRFFDVFCRRARSHCRTDAQAADGSPKCWDWA